jgi:hypothetical protein
VLASLSMTIKNAALPILRPVRLHLPSREECGLKPHFQYTTCE